MNEPSDKGRGPGDKDGGTGPDETKPTKGATSGKNLPAVLFLPEMAELLRCSTGTIRRRVKEGKIPAPMSAVDHRWRWSRDRVLEWINQTTGPKKRRKW